MAKNIILDPNINGSSLAHLKTCAEFLVGCTPNKIQVTKISGNRNTKIDMQVSKEGLIYSVVILCNITDQWGDLCNIYHKLLTGCHIILYEGAAAVIIFNSIIASTILYLKYHPKIQIIPNETTN